MNTGTTGYEWDQPTLQAPGVVTWFKVYAGAMLLLYLFVMGMGVLFLVNPDLMVDPDAGMSSNRPADTAEAVIMGALYLGLGSVFALAFLVSFFLPRSKGTWIYDLVLICLGLTSCCCLPASIPLLIFWIKQETRDWFYGG